mmetsp:Transcript_25888/g.81277  ORF Transcript_25888/g.81277 Transcript_25888/m.81277 type:complete len:699 (-) Transcript_25888:321-2417(-)
MAPEAPHFRRRRGLLQAPAVPSEARGRPPAGALCGLPRHGRRRRRPAFGGRGAAALRSRATRLPSCRRPREPAARRRVLRRRLRVPRSRRRRAARGPARRRGSLARDAVRRPEWRRGQRVWRGGCVQWARRTQCAYQPHGPHAPRVLLVPLSSRRLGTRGGCNSPGRAGAKACIEALPAVHQRGTEASAGASAAEGFQHSRAGDSLRSGRPPGGDHSCLRAPGAPAPFGPERGGLHSPQPARGPAGLPAQEVAAARLCHGFGRLRGRELQVRSLRAASNGAHADARRGQPAVLAARCPRLGARPRQHPGGGCGEAGRSGLATGDLSDLPALAALPRGLGVRCRLWPAGGWAAAGARALARARRERGRGRHRQQRRRHPGHRQWRRCRRRRRRLLQRGHPRHAEPRLLVNARLPRSLRAKPRARAQQRHLRAAGRTAGGGHVLRPAAVAVEGCGAAWEEGGGPGEEDAGRASTPEGPPLEAEGGGCGGSRQCQLLPHYPRLLAGQRPPLRALALHHDALGPEPHGLPAALLAGQQLPLAAVHGPAPAPRDQHGGRRLRPCVLQVAVLAELAEGEAAPDLGLQDPLPGRALPHGRAQGDLRGLRPRRPSGPEGAVGHGPAGPGLRLHALLLRQGRAARRHQRRAQEQRHHGLPLLGCRLLEGAPRQAPLPHQRPLRGGPAGVQAAVRGRRAAPDVQRHDP